jgi:hypothetical protein
MRKAILRGRAGPLPKVLKPLEEARCIEGRQLDFFDAEATSGRRLLLATPMLYNLLREPIV